jgi:zinc transporter 1
MIALIAIKFSKKQSTTKNTYGWARSEVLGSLVNAVFLLALCFSIIVEAINRLFEPHPLRRIELIITVGLVGLIINVIGLILFSLLGGHHFHSHGPSHNHTHHQHIHNHQDPTQVKYSNLNDKFASINDVNAQFKFSKLQFQNQHCHEHENDSNMNIRGVFLHVMADALGSIAVIVSAVLVKYVPPDDANWKIYIDPILSLILTMFIIASVIPLLKESSHILLQSIPYGTNINEIKTNILKINGVLNIHNFHLWGLNSESYIATMHVKISRELDYLNRDVIIKKIKNVLHLNNIHTTTLQLEIESADFEYACCSKDTCLAKNKDLKHLLTAINNVNNAQMNKDETINNNNNDSSLLANDSVILEGHNQFL